MLDFVTPASCTHLEMLCHSSFVRVHGAQAASAAPCTSQGLLHHAFRQPHAQSARPALAASPQAASKQEPRPRLSDLTATGSPVRGLPVGCKLHHNCQAFSPCSHTATAAPTPVPWRHKLYPGSGTHVSACVLPLTPPRLSCPSGASRATTTRLLARLNMPLLHSCACRCPALHVQAAPWQQGSHLSHHASNPSSNPCPLSLQARAVP